MVEASTTGKPSTPQSMIRRDISMVLAERKEPTEKEEIEYKRERENKTEKTDHGF